MCISRYMCVSTIVLTPLQKYYCFIITLQGEQAEYGHTYTVNSESSDQQYTVHILASQCTQGENCIPHCMQGKCSYLCRHMISCSCYDYSHGHLCKHTHKVQTVHQDHIKGQAISDDITSGVLLNVCSSYTTCTKALMQYTQQRNWTHL